MTAKLTIAQSWFIPSKVAAARKGTTKLQRSDELGVTWTYQAGAVVELVRPRIVRLPGGLFGRLSDDCGIERCDEPAEDPERSPAQSNGNRKRKAVAK